MTARAFCFTDFENKSEIDIVDRAKADKQCNFIILQEEKCPKTGKVHYQGYLQFASPQRWSRVKKIVSKSAHLQASKGTLEQNIAYCSKSATHLRGPWQWGVGKSQGQRLDLENCIQMVQEGKTDLEIYQANPSQFVRLKKFIGTARNMEQQKIAVTFRNVEVLIFYGDAGTGKTREAFSVDPQLYTVPDPEGNRVWFDGYEGQCTILLDDFYGWIKYHLLLRMLDGYPIRMQTKGGFSSGCWTRVIITSNKHPSEWYQVGLTKALNRRITKITRFSDLGQCHEVTGGNTSPRVVNPFKE